MVDTAAAGVRADHSVLSGLRFLEVCSRGVGDANRADAKQMAVVPVSLFTPCGTRLSLLVVSGVEVAAVVGPRRNAAVVGHGLYAVEGEFADAQDSEFVFVARLLHQTTRVGSEFPCSCVLCGKTQKKARTAILDTPQKALEYILKLQALEIPSMAPGLRDETGQIKNQPSRLLTAAAIASMTPRQQVEKTPGRVLGRRVGSPARRFRVRGSDCAGVPASG